MNTNPEPWASEECHYCLMEKDGKFQWRWMAGIPAECNGERAYNPAFDDIPAAVAWMKNKVGTNLVLWRDNEGWVQVDPNRYEPQTRIS